MKKRFLKLEFSRLSTPRSVKPLPKFQLLFTFDTFRCAQLPYLDFSPFFTPLRVEKNYTKSNFSLLFTLRSVRKRYYNFSFHYLHLAL